MTLIEAIQIVVHCHFNPSSKHIIDPSEAYEMVSNEFGHGFDCRKVALAFIENDDYSTGGEYELCNM